MPKDAHRLLVLTYHFPPDGAVGGLRWAGITKYLARMGWEISVVTAAAPAVSDSTVSVQVESCPRSRTLVDLYQLLRRAAQRSWRCFPQASNGARVPSLRGLLRRLRSESAAFLALPDESRGWLLRATLRARSLLGRFRPEVIVSSGPPHAVHLVARLATVGSPVRWFIDLRDPWAGPRTSAWKSHPIASTWMAGAVLPRLERLAFRAVEGVIVNTPRLAEALAARYPDVALTCIPNGVDPEGLPPPARDRYPGLAVVHAGTLYGNRDLGAVLRALRLFLERHPEAGAAGSKLRIAGEAEEPAARALQQAVAALRLEQFVDVVGPLPRAEALTVVSRSHLAVVLAQGQELQVPAKLYESVAMGVPTLIVAERESAAGLEGKRLGVAVIDPSDVAGIAYLLDQLWRNETPPATQCRGAITYEAIAPLVHNLFAARASSAPEVVSSLQFDRAPYARPGVRGVV